MTGPGITPDDVREILRLIEESPYEEFELETEHFSIRVGREHAAAGTSPQPEAGLVDVIAPMVGIVYRGASPGAPPFVEVGNEVRVGTQLCIIEVMKLMNSVTAGVAGTVAEVCVENGAAVQYGDVLFRVRADV